MTLDEFAPGTSWNPGPHVVVPKQRRQRMVVSPEKVAQLTQDLVRARKVVEAARAYVCGSPDPLDVVGQYERLADALAVYDGTKAPTDGDAA